MEEGRENQVIDLVNKFKKATLDLGDINEIEVIKNNKEDETEDNWDASW